MAKVDDLITALRAISPMPDDDDIDALTEEILIKYESIVKELGELQDPKAIVPLINSFGYGEGFGLYRSTLYYLEKFDLGLLYPQLIDAVRTGEKGPRMWTTFMLGRIRNPEAVDDLIALLQDDYELVRANAAMALGMIRDKKAKPHLEACKNDVSEEVKLTALEALDDMD
jgi:HEAT repeat protein